jgi:hypothetical protein
LHFKSLLNSPCWTPIGQFVSHLHFFSLGWQKQVAGGFLPSGMTMMNKQITA